jgi:hypothetical protein
LGGGTGAVGGGTGALGGGSGAMGGGSGAMGGGQAAATVGISGNVTEADGTPIPNAKVEVVGGTASATTDDTGAYTLTVTVGDLFLRSSEGAHKTTVQGLRVGADGDAGTTASFVMAITDSFDTAPTQLDPPITPNAGNGVVVVEFHSDTDFDGTFGAELLTLTHDPTYSLTGGAGDPYFTDGGTALQAGGDPLIFPNVMPGTTPISLDPAPMASCTFDPPFTTWRVEAGAVMRVIAQCQ